MPRNPHARRCTATSKQTGKPCGNAAIPGGLVCRHHGGGAPQVRARATVVAEIDSWGLGDTTVDPGETLLRLLSQAVARAEKYAAQVAAQVEEHGLYDALVGDRLIQDPDSGRVTKIDEYVRAMALIEAQERDRAAKFAKMAIEAGLAERQVRLAERQGALIEQVLVAAFEHLELTAEQRRAAPDAIRAALAIVA